MVAVIVFILFELLSKERLVNSGKLVTPQVFVLPPQSKGSKEIQKTQTTLKETIEQALLGAKGTYGILIKSLETGVGYSNNEHRIYKAGSLYKLWIMAEVFKKLEEGTLQEDQILTAEVKTLNKKFGIDPNTAELTEGVITSSIRDALRQMITISHNYAALLLTEKLRLSTIAKFLKDNGFNESRVGISGEDPITSAYDIALFLEKLSGGKLANPENTTKMLDLLKRQQLNDKLPKYLPSDTPVAHKTGEISYSSHDAGIVYTPNNNYLIVILSDSDYPPGAEERIALVSKAVYDYFSNKQ